MLFKKITKISQVLALMAMVFGVGTFYQTNAAAASAMAFDDDKKGKKQDKHGDQGKRGGQDKQDKREDRGDRGNRGRDPQRDSDREARRQQEQSDRNSRHQQRQSDQNSRQQQAESDRRSRQQDNWGNGRSGGGRRMIIEDNHRDRNDRRRNDDRRVIYAAPGAFIYQNQNVRPPFGVDNRRLIREQQKFFKEQSKAQRRYQNEQQRYAPNQYRSYSAPVYGYDNNYYTSQSNYDRGSSWKGQILPMLIANIFGGGTNSYNTGFPQDRYARTNVDQYGYQDRQPAYAPAYNYGPSYDSSYNNNYGYDDLYSYNQQGFDTASVLSSLPIAEIISQYTGENEFVSGLIGSFLSQGYDQGLIAGQNAQQYGYTDAQYNDPYTYQNGAYDPYSVSLGENRRYLSEGYEQGYRDGYEEGQRDGLSGNAQYGQVNAGESDLIGVLLNSMLSSV